MNEVINKTITTNRNKRGRRKRKGILKGTYLWDDGRWYIKLIGAFVGAYKTELEAHNRYLEEEAWSKSVRDSIKAEEQRRNRVNRFNRQYAKNKQKRAKAREEKLKNFLDNRLESELKRIKEQKEAKRAAKKEAQNDKAK